MDKKKILLIFIASILYTQPPEWDVNPSEYEHVMSVTAIIIGEEEASSGDILAAFNGQGNCVGVTLSTNIPFGPYSGQEAFLIQIYSNSFSGGETIFFKFYNHETEITYPILQSIDFIQDGVVGNLVDPFLFSLMTNSAPNTQNASYTLDEDTAITLLLDAYDQDGDTLDYIITEGPLNGTITLSGNVATYIPNINFNGIDSFQFKVNDGQEDSNIATITLVVNAVNDAPYLYSIDNATVMFGEIFSYPLQAEDADGDNLIYTTTVSGGNAVANVEENILSVIPQEPNITLNIMVTVSDGNATHTIMFTLMVLAQQTNCLDNNSDGWCDHFPTMNISGESVLLLGVDIGAEYTDEGATCSDNEEGDITHQVEVSGQVVNMSVPSTYEIYYNCSDSESNAAQTLTRTVVVLPDLISDQNEDGLDDAAFTAGAQSGDVNLDGTLNVIDLVIYIDIILNGE